MPPGKQPMSETKRRRLDAEGFEYFLDEKDAIMRTFNDFELDILTRDKRKI